MPEEDHKLLRWVHDYVTNPDQPTDDAMKKRFVRLSDGARTEELQNLGTWFHDDSTIRQKASLLKLGCELHKIHTALRKVGR